MCLTSEISVRGSWNLVTVIFECARTGVCVCVCVCRFSVDGSCQIFQNGDGFDPPEEHVHTKLVFKTTFVLYLSRGRRTSAL